MHTTRDKRLIARIGFFVVVFLTTVCVTEADIPFAIFYNKTGNFVRMIKLFLCFVLPMTMVYLDYKIERSFRFMGRACAIIMSLFSVCYLLDLLAFNLNSNHGKNYSIYHIAFSSASVAGVMLCAIIICALDKDNRGKNDFDRFYAHFFEGFAVMLAMILVYSFIISRVQSNYGYELVFKNNFIPFNGELKRIVCQLSFFNLVRTGGNMLMFTSLALTVMRFAPKNKLVWGACAPIGFSVIVELIELLLKSGDTDIDDIVINAIGVAIAIIIQKYVFNRLLANKDS